MEEIQNKFVQVIGSSTMSVPMYKHSGHTQNQTLPCTIYGLYNPKTGTVLVVEVWADDHMVMGPSQLASHEVEQFRHALETSIIVNFD